MNGLSIRLQNGYQDVCDLWKIIDKYPDTTDFNIYQRRFIVDGKSILGIMGLELNKMMTVEILTTNKDEEKRFYDEIKRWEFHGAADE